MMEIVIPSTGEKAHCIYSDDLPLAQIGKLKITRASHVEPREDGQWIADLSPVNGPVLGPFVCRSDALAAEVDWLRMNWLNLQPT